MPFDLSPYDLAPRFDPARPAPARRPRGGGAAAKAAGMAAETAAWHRYRKGGARLLARNWRAPRLYGGGELDLVLERDGGVIFVEVKARRTLHEAGYAIRPAQLDRMRRAAEGYMIAADRWGQPMQFDLVLCDRYGAMQKIPSIWFD